MRVNCSYFEDIEVEANNVDEAKKLAEIEFDCAGGCPEVEEILI